MATPVITNVDNVNHTYMADGQKYALNPTTNRFQLASTLSTPAPSSVSSSSLQPSSQINIPQTNVSQIAPLPIAQTDVNTQTTQNTQAEQGYNQANSDLQMLSSQLANKGTDTLALEQQQGIQQISQNVLDLQDLANQKALEANLTPYSLQGQGRGITTGILRGQEAVKQRQLQIEGIFANAQLQAAQGKLQLAQSQVDRAINLKYEPILAKIDAQKQILENNKYLLSRSDQKLAEAKSVLLDKQKQDELDKKASDKAIQDLMVNASSQGAPSSIISKAQSIMNNGGTPTQVASALGQYAGNFIQNEYIKSQTAKNYADAIKAKVEANIKDITKVDAKVQTIQTAQNIIGIVNDIQNSPGKSQGVGASSIFNKLPGTQGKDFALSVDQLKNTLALPNLSQLKGSMSDKDLMFLTNIGTKLNTSMTPAAFDTELQKVKDKFTEILTTNGVDPNTITDDYFKSQQKAIQQSNSQQVKDSNFINSLLGK